MEREVQVLSIAEFCEENRISRSRLYQEFLAGTGPRHFYAGKRKLITREASADWRRAREAAAGASATKARAMPLEEFEETCTALADASADRAA